MSDGTAEDAEVTGDDAGTETSSHAAVSDGDGGVTDIDVWRYLRLGAVALLSLLALLATVRLYTSASAAIAGWVSPDFVPVFQAAFNLVVLLLALAGLAALYRWR